MSTLSDILQAASNTAADTVSAPVDILAWLSRKAGIPVGNAPVGGSDWMRAQGLTRPVQQSAASLTGETLGLLSPIAAAAKGPQIARGLLAAGDNLAAPVARGPMATQRGAIVYHGSPHKFDKFDASKIGTGEGAQAYGHGLYLADKADTALTYMPRDPSMESKLMARYSAAERQQQYPSMQVFEDFLLHKTPSEVASNIAAAGYSPAELRQAQQALKIATTQYHNQRAGALYKVDLPDEAIARMLDWDKPLSQQAPGVRDALRKLGVSVDDAALGRFDDALLDALNGGPLALPKQPVNPAGDFVYRRLGGADVAADKLRAQGIPGIRYLDGGSRGAGTGTSNYVVFPGEEELLRIIERNGKGLLSP